MSCIVPRTCTEVRQADTEQDRDARSRPLAEFRAVPAYVLLGDPGSGKSTSFEAESNALGEEACLVTARDFLALEPAAHPEWLGKTLFIDGLDEVRIGSSDARTPFDKLRGRLDALGRPRFRLSCREADWLGTNDRNNLATVSPDADLTVLRLDPLSDEYIEQILTTCSGIDARSFIATAREKGVAGFLDNPQCLNMLTEVVTSGGNWPGSRLELFGQACLRMVCEDNEEHIAAAERSSPSAAIAEDDLLNAAGRLCAVLLISGSAGWAVAGRREDADYPDLNRCAREHRERTRQAISTKLFKAVAEGRFRPVHRHVAEFQAGRYLARLIDGEGRNGRRGRYGLPARRIVALIAGHDGGVVTELRGLSAWIAAFSGSARNELLERDPIGVGLYGDIGEFLPQEKRDLLASLQRESSRLHLASRATAAFGSLATSDMQPAIEEILRDTGREPEHQSFVGFVLDVLLHGSMPPGLADSLLALVYDDTWSSHVNALALRAFLHHCPDGVRKTNKLKALLADVHTEVIPDPDEELRGLLLSSLFPRDVPPPEVWRYLTATEETLVFGSCWRFWFHQIPDESSDEEAVELLDSLARRLPEVRSALEIREDVRETPTKLLVRALCLRGDSIGTKRLYDWLSVGVVMVREALREHYPTVRGVRLWLEHRPDVQKAVLMEGLKRCAAVADFWVQAFEVQAFEVRNRLYGVRRPPDFGLWCLSQSASMADTRLQLAEYLLWEARRAHNEGEGNEGLSLDVLTAHVRQHEELRPVWEQMTCPPAWSDDTEERKRHEEERQQKEDEWVAHVRFNASALNENRAAPALLFQMARAYFGDFVSFCAENGPRGVEKLLQGDRNLTRAALAGLRGAIDRPDVPEIEEILDLRKRNRMHYLLWPFLAGLAEIERTSAEDVSRWDESRIRKALTFYYLTPHADYSPEWYKRLIEKCSDRVADVFAGIVAASGFRGDGSVASVLWSLAHDLPHAHVARLASLRLLAAFPTRCTTKQLESLDRLLRAALQYADRARLLELVDRKLRRRSMNDSQRVRWLACGVLVVPERYQSRLRDFAGGRERRTWHLVDFLFPEESTPAWRPSLDKRGLELFIGLLGPYSDPDRWSQAGVVTSAMWASERVSGMIGELAALPDEDVSRTLEELAAEPTLARWRPVLLQARDDQRVVRRDATYRHPDVKQICLTLDDGPPANPADLAALVTDRLAELGDRIRNGNTDDWRQYWNENEYGRPCKPKHEESCRDALLSDLRQCLPDELDAQPEGQYANDKRADIRISCRDFQIPVEIKKNGHRKLWSALGDQLIAQYTRDPATDGYGIYLVIWFGEGEGHHKPPPSFGVYPDGPDALKARLEEALKPEEARKISVCVIDVSAPAADAQ